MENDLKTKKILLSEVVVQDIDKIKIRIRELFDFVNKSRSLDLSDFDTKHNLFDKICSDLSSLNYNDLSQLKTEIIMTK